MLELASAPRGFKDGTGTRRRHPLGDTVGLRPVSADDGPIVGRLDAFENVFVDTGHGTDGLLLGPYCGHLLAAEMGGSPQATLAAYAPGRFSP
jgi:D-amino-acid dehydrogenase